jgi:hypothetical protein
MTVPADFKCPACGMVSHNPHDIEESYCGACHRFFDEALHPAGVRFTCVDCGFDVYAFAMDKLPDPAVCSTCSFIRTLPEGERDAVRRISGHYDD